MKFITTAVVFLIFSYFSFVSSKSLKHYNGNKVSTFKGERKPLASRVVNGIHDNYTRYKRQTPKAVLDFQDLLLKSKRDCVRELNMPTSAISKSLMNEENPTNEEKCLMACTLKKCKLMDNNNQLSVQNTVALAHAASSGNDLVKAIAKATAEKCNTFVTTHNTCEAAGQINKCMSREIKMYKMKLVY